MTHLVNVPNARERVRADQETLAVATGATGSQYRRAAHTHRNICARHSFFSRAMTSRDPHYVAKSAHLFSPFLRACVPPPSDTPAVSASAGKRKQTALCLPASAVNVIQSPLRNNHERNRSQAANIATKQTRFAEVRRAAPTVRLNDKRYMAAT
jgi:hypothetical protein